MANFGLLLAEMGVEVPSLDMSAMMPVLQHAWTWRYENCRKNAESK